MGEPLVDSLVSVIMPAKNASATLLRGAESVLRQSYAELELWIIDNESDDGTLSIAQELAEKDPRVHVLSCLAPGAAAARNVGLDQAKGRYVAFLDADDEWDEHKLLRHLAFLKESDAPYSYTSYWVVFEKKPDKKKLFHPRYARTKYKRMLRFNDVGCSTVLCDREKIPEVRMCEAATKREDYACWLKLAREGKEGVLFDEPLTTYHMSNTSVSHYKLQMFTHQWNVCHNIEGHNVFFSTWLMICHVWYRLFKGY
ncbi:MAG: glycosyltransferase [Bacilli bacterium]|nr:glycosyltransferase [Bacilli bacterium]